MLTLLNQPIFLNKMNDNLLPLTLKRQLSKEGKLLLVRSLSHGEDNDADNTIMIGTNDDGSVNTLAHSLTLIQHPVLGKLPLVRIINSFLEYDNFVENELAKLNSLRESGVLTQEEFEKAKNKLLNT